MYLYNFWIVCVCMWEREGERRSRFYFHNLKFHDLGKKVLRKDDGAFFSKSWRSCHWLLLRLIQIRNQECHFCSGLLPPILFYPTGEHSVLLVSSVHQDWALHSVQSITAPGGGQGLVYLGDISILQPGQLYVLGVELLCLAGDTYLFFGVGCSKIPPGRWEDEVIGQRLRLHETIRSTLLITRGPFS